MSNETAIQDDALAEEAIQAFAREAGLANVPVVRAQVGNRQFIKFKVGKNAPLYTYALHRAQQAISEHNPFRGALGLDISTSKTFPSSLEASALLTLLTRSTREVVSDTADRGYSVPYIPFQNREDQQLAQPASHIVRGRRGVGKSTLIRRAVEILAAAKALVAVLDMQAYSSLSQEDLQYEVFQDVCLMFSESAARIAGASASSEELQKLSDEVANRALELPRIPPSLKRVLRKVTQAIDGHAFLFLDDFHLIDRESQPELLHNLHGGMKGANGWLKVAGLSSLLNTYSAATGQGLQVPGDAQIIALDLTLENFEAAEGHLRTILGSFLRAVGYQVSAAVISDSAFRRLVWATAGVPRDFLQMFARAVEHAQRNKHSSVTLSDVNIAIGEFGQQKMDDLSRDARNTAGTLKNFLGRLEELCLDEAGVNAFLVKSEDSRERDLVRALSDLRMVHLIHQSITPDRAGERYEAYIIDYSIFTGFRRRRNIQEMVPQEAQFKASELRALPKVSAGFIPPSN
ncbi:MAG TPA: ATP-binding protein [Acidobacteriaceae bacterium]